MKMVTSSRDPNTPKNKFRLKMTLFWLITEDGSILSSSLRVLFCNSSIKSRETAFLKCESLRWGLNWLEFMRELFISGKFDSVSNAASSLENGVVKVLMK